tara:strand:- start:13087 stop:13416 length:330 start_codon:yes stop_codon:yes gene_type:complete
MNEVISLRNKLFGELQDTNEYNGPTAVQENNEGNEYSGPTDQEVEESNESSGLREIIIKPLDSGYLVKVGCQTLAVETTKQLITSLSDYLTNPRLFESEWNRNKNRNKL